MMTLRFFLIVGSIISIWSCSGYTIEKDKVYYVKYNEAQGKVKRDIGADKKTFKVLEIENYAIDFNHVFYQGDTIDSADPKTFVPLAEFIGKDKKHGYYAQLLIKNSDGQTFEVIDGNFTRDKNEVYYRDKPLHSTSPKSFEILKIGHGLWAKDDNAYYYTHIKVPLMDYKSFQILDEDCFFAKDKFQVYKQAKVLEGVDAETFKFLERCIGQDKFGCHNGYERCDCPAKKE